MTRLESEIIHIEEQEGNQPLVKGIPEGESVLFFAKISGQFENGTPCDKEYCVVYGPETCLPRDYPMSELWDAKIAIGRAGLPLTIQQVRHGHKYREGGFVEFGNLPVFRRNQIFFRTLNEVERSTFNGREIDDVYFVL